MAKAVTLEQLEAAKPDQRIDLFRRCQEKGTPEALTIMQLMLDHDLLKTAKGGLPFEHPTIRQLREIVRSAGGRSAALEATAAKMPAYAGVDPLLRGVPGYGGHDTLSWAGGFVVEVMEEAGYAHRKRSKALPQGSIAKTGAYFGE